MLIEYICTIHNHLSPEELLQCGKLAATPGTSPNSFKFPSNFKQYPDFQNALNCIYKLPPSIVHFLRPEKCTQFHWDLENNKHKICPDCGIIGAGVERNLSFPLHFTDKDNDLNRFVYVETFETASDGPRGVERDDM